MNSCGVDRSAGRSLAFLSFTQGQRRRPAPDAGSDRVQGAPHRISLGNRMVLSLLPILVASCSVDRPMDVGSTHGTGGRGSAGIERASGIGGSTMGGDETVGNGGAPSGGIGSVEADASAGSGGSAARAQQDLDGGDPVADAGLEASTQDGSSDAALDALSSRWTEGPCAAPVGERLIILWAEATRAAGRPTTVERPFRVLAPIPVCIEITSQAPSCSPSGGNTSAVVTLDSDVLLSKNVFSPRLALEQTLSAGEHVVSIDVTSAPSASVRAVISTVPVPGQLFAAPPAYSDTSLPLRDLPQLPPPPGPTEDPPDVPNVELKRCDEELP
jgi:hypothetical protein